MDFEQDSDFSEDLPQDLLHEDNVQSDQDIDNIDEFNNIDGLLYNLDEIQELVSNHFQDAEKLNEPVKINFEIELDSALIESIFPEFILETQDFETIKESFYQLIQSNIEYNIQNSELYRHLQHENLIDMQIYTKEQLLSTKKYLESKEHKILYYLNNDFVKVLGFTTSLFNSIDASNLKEIIISDGNTRNLCSDNHIQEIVDIVK
ncbi:877_t:CDS:2, partial [Cetraspora pellucida]